jgi:threonine/homoserine/homoserine lactone efflux protein
VIALLGAAAVYGLSAGFSPGPLLALVISQSIRYGVREGARAAMAPLITDLPIILLCMMVLWPLADSRPALGLISMAGGLFVLYLAWGCFRTTRLELTDRGEAPQSLGKGAAVNALNPHPYLFWLTVGSPAVLGAWAESPARAVAFVAVFSACIVGSKVLVAFVAGRSRNLLIGKAYGAVMRALGLALLLFAFLLFREGLALTGFPAHS